MLSGNLLQQQIALATLRNNPILAAAMLSSNSSMVAQVSSRIFLYLKKIF